MRFYKIMMKSFGRHSPGVIDFFVVEIVYSIPTMSDRHRYQIRTRNQNFSRIPCRIWQRPNRNSVLNRIKHLCRCNSLIIVVLDENLYQYTGVISQFYFQFDKTILENVDHLAKILWNIRADNVLAYELDLNMHSGDGVD